MASLSEACGASAIDEISPTVRQQLLTPQTNPKISDSKPTALARSLTSWILPLDCHLCML